MEQKSTYMDLNFNSAMTLIKYPKNFIKNISEEDFENFLNRRVEVSEFVGTVRYVGNLKHKKDDDLWVGVEWDDHTRGKHNGAVGNVEYFKTEHSTAGSLIKFSKVNFGLSFQEAVKFKYNFFDSNSDDFYQFLNRAVESDLYIQANKKRINIELVGKEKAIQKFSKLDSILNIDLAFSFISEIELDLSSVFPRLKELILHRTLLNKWSQFLKIFVNFPILENLTFTDNNLTFDDEFYSLKEKINPEEIKLNYLVLNRCKVDFNTIANISFLMKKVENLYLFGNELNETTYASQKEIVDKNRKEMEENLKNLSFISLERNKIKKFCKVLEGLCITKINRMNLNQNHINQIVNEKEDQQIIDKINPHLYGLYLDFNQFTSETQTFREIALFSNLVDLDILNNSIINKIGIENAKFEIVGRLLKLQTLNNTSIPKDLRRDCELLYLKSSVNEYIKLNLITAKESFNKDKFENYMNEHHPNYLILKKKYYDPLEDILDNVKQVDPNTIKGNIIEVSFKYGEKVITKKFPKTTTFANLRNLLSKLFKISGHFSFYLNENEIVTDETNSLDNYSVSSGHMINII